MGKERRYPKFNCAKCDNHFTAKLDDMDFRAPSLEDFPNQERKVEECVCKKCGLINTVYWYRVGEASLFQPSTAS
jgi:hypothetical protein